MVLGLLEACRRSILNVWTDHYLHKLELQRRQNIRIMLDFSDHLPGDSQIRAALEQAETVLEIGCGTGELSYWIQSNFGPKVLGIDLAQPAIDSARAAFGSICMFNYGSFEDLSGEYYDLAVSSNTLEHFINYKKVLSAWLELAPLVLLIAPYQETCRMQVNEVDGGIHHSVRLDEQALADFTIVDSFIFRSKGWLNGEDPRQWAVLVENG